MNTLALLLYAGVTLPLPVSPLEECVYDRALEYFQSAKEGTPENNHEAEETIREVCIGHALPLTDDEIPVVAEALKRAFREVWREPPAGQSSGQLK